MAQSFLPVVRNYTTTQSGLHGIPLHSFRGPCEEQYRGETDPTDQGASAAERGHRSHRGAQLMKGKSSHATRLWTQVHRGTRTAVWAGPGYCPGAHHVPQQDTKADFLRSSQHPQRAPAAICQLDPACRAWGDTSQWQYLQKHTPPRNGICSSKLSAVHLLGTGHFMPQDAEHRELPTQTTLEKNWAKLCDLRIRVVLQTSGSNLTTPRAVHCFQVDQ